MLDDDEGQDDPVHILVDSNAFGRRSWVEALIDSSQAGHVTLYWSPTIIEEMARFRQLLWMRNWLRGGGTRLTEAVTRRFSEDAHRWMDFVSPHFHVVEDKPPHSPAWADPLPDPYDAPIWTAARRAGASVIVTQNLEVGPPPDEHGIQVFDGVLYLDPDDLTAFLDWLGDDYEAVRLLPADRQRVADGDAPGVTPETTGQITLPPAIRDFLLELERRRGDELPPQADHGPG